MFALSLLSGTIFVLPILVTFGVFFAVEHEKILRCGFNCGGPGDFPGDVGGGGGSGGTTTGDIAGKQFCQKSYAITPSPGDYVYNPNQWGDPDNTGALCLNFTTSTSDVQSGYAAGWYATWTYPIPGPVTAPVHAFPNAGLTDDSLPVQMQSLAGLTLDVQWTYAVGDIPASATDFNSLTDANVNANVCLDMFLASNEGDATSTTKSDYEVMVWLGRIGPATDPVGFANGTLTTRTIGSTEFSLYMGMNPFGQRAFTWMAAENTTTFTGDVSPLIHNLTPYNGPEPTDYLGYAAFGSETYNAAKNATFYVPKLEMSLSSA